uniref:Uncharacterized protein n=1 Tax=Grammatophora oceanica TaxID=210454 RepID=A0A7S1V9P8_9STRA
MADCVDLVLAPVVTARAHCRRRGSVGRLLPMHIASIYNVTFQTFEQCLTTYPEAAGVPCDCFTLVAWTMNDSLPLELLAWRRTIFFKKPDDDDFQKRSDLLFVFYPGILPFRREVDRLARMESMIQRAARSAVENGDGAELDAAAKSAWIWLVTFEDNIGETDGTTTGYEVSVSTVLAFESDAVVTLLANVETFEGPLLRLASPLSAKIIKERLEVTKVTSETPILTRVSSDSSDSVLASEPPCEAGEGGEASVVSSSHLSTAAERDTPVPDSTLEVGSISKTVFNIKEASIPCSFVILPYKLLRSADGTLALADMSWGSVAIRFGETLVELTDPNKVEHILQRKSMDFLGQRTTLEQMEIFDICETRQEKTESDLLVLFEETKVGYLYLLDENTGIPLVPRLLEQSCYPIEIKKPSETVRQLLPMMLMGMILMRGEQSLYTLLSVVLNEIYDVPERWVSLALNVANYLNSPLGRQDERPCIEELEHLKGRLEAFAARAAKNEIPTSAESPNGLEWSLEISILSVLLAGADRRREFCGLQKEFSPNGIPIWTQPNGGRCPDISLADDLTIFSSVCSSWAATPMPQSKVSSTGSDSGVLAVRHRNNKKESTSETSSSNHASGEEERFEEKKSELDMVKNAEAVLTPSTADSSYDPSGAISPSSNWKQKNTGPPPRPSTRATMRTKEKPPDKANSRATVEQTGPVLSAKNSIAKQRRETSTPSDDGTDSSKKHGFPIVWTHSKSEDPSVLTEVTGLESRANDAPEIRFSSGPPSTVSKPVARRIVKPHSSAEDIEPAVSMVHTECQDVHDARSMEQTLNKQENELKDLRSKLSQFEQQTRQGHQDSSFLANMSRTLSSYDSKAIGCGSVVGEKTSVGDVHEDNGLDDTQRVLARLCSLEERLLTREIDLQQLKLDLQAFELRAVHEGNLLL